MSTWRGERGSVSMWRGEGGCEKWALFSNPITKISMCTTAPATETTDLEGPSDLVAQGLRSEGLARPRLTVEEDGDPLLLADSEAPLAKQDRPVGTRRSSTRNVTNGSQ